MTKRMATAGCLVACLCAGSALALEPVRVLSGGPRALHEYRSTTQHALFDCGTPFSARQARTRTGNALAQYRSCVARIRTEVTIQLDAATRSLEGSSCVGALRSYHVAFEQALSGIEPLAGETPMAYDQRQAFLFHAMAHAWGRFEIAESLSQ